jgi:hypothetical protein
VQPKDFLFGKTIQDGACLTNCLDNSFTDNECAIDDGGGAVLTSY